MATDSSGCEEVVQLRRALTMFETVRDNAQRQSLCLGQRLFSSGAVSEYARKIDHVSEPAAVVLSLQLNSEQVAHGREPNMLSTTLRRDRSAPGQRIADRLVLTRR